MKTWRKNGKGKVRLNDELALYITQADAEGIQKSLTLKAAWEEACGRQALEHTDNVTYSKRGQGTVILVYMDDSHWAAELSMSKELLRLKLTRALGQPIDDIIFEVNRRAALKRVFTKSAREPKEEAWRVPPEALTSDEERHAREILAGITHEKLRKSLYRAMKADLEWKKGIQYSKSSQKAPESPETL
ncbi:MAG: DciA family protein [Coriobacteriales bacterium]|jgi:hypothetical protein|nr:DciA family protein [Coriobacteriales bacterium]